MARAVSNLLQSTFTTLSSRNVAPITVLHRVASCRLELICLSRVWMPEVKALQGRLRRRPYNSHIDKGYDYQRCRTHLKKRGILSRIARRGVESSEKLGKHRWVVERTHRWFAGFGKLRVRFERQLKYISPYSNWRQRSSAHALLTGCVRRYGSLPPEACAPHQAGPLCEILLHGRLPYKPL